MWTHAMTLDSSVLVGRRFLDYVGACRDHVCGSMLTSPAFIVVMAMIYLHAESYVGCWLTETNNTSVNRVAPSALPPLHPLHECCKHN